MDARKRGKHVKSVIQHEMDARKRGKHVKSGIQLFDWNVLNNMGRVRGY